jgi:PAS domain S-box-containing protein
VSSLSAETWYILLLISLTFVILAAAFVFSLITSNRRLKKERDFSSTIVDTNPALIIAFDKEGKIVRFNKSCELIGGYTSHEVMGRSFSELPIVGDKIFSTDGHLLENKPNQFPTYFESQWITKSRKKCTIAWSSVELEKTVGNIKWIISGIDITEQKKAEEDLNKYHKQLQKLSAHLQSVREEEQARISREIHDVLGQTLSTVLLDISWLEKHESKEDKKKWLEKLNSVSRNIENTIKQVQKISSDLRPTLLDNLGLAAAIEWQIKEFTKKTGIRCFVSLENKELEVNKEVSTTVFRILQESLTNVLRHANATEVKANLIRKSNKLLLEIRDNGVGILNGQINNPNSLGLLGIQERVRSLKGKIDIIGFPGKGTTIKVSLPIK